MSQSFNSKFVRFSSAALVTMCLLGERSAAASDFSLFPHSMMYDTDKSQDEYITYIFNNKDKTIFKCKAIYKLTDNTLKSDGCTDPTSLPFSLDFADASSARTTIVFSRFANRSGQGIFGPDGIWQLDEKTGSVEFCVFGDLKAKCVSIKSN